MFRKHFSVFIFFVLMLSSFNCFAKTSSEGLIASIHGNKIYLKPGSIQIANNGIFLLQSKIN